LKGTKLKGTKLELRGRMQAAYRRVCIVVVRLSESLD